MKWHPLRQENRIFPLYFHSLKYKGKYIKKSLYEMIWWVQDCFWRCWLRKSQLFQYLNLLDFEISLHYYSLWIFHCFSLGLLVLHTNQTKTPHTRLFLRVPIPNFVTILGFELILPKFHYSPYISPLNFNSDAVQ